MKKYTYNFQSQPRINPVEQLINSAVQFHQQGNLKLAEQNYRQALELQPKNAYALNLLGVLYSQKGEHKEGEKLIKKAIKTDPDVADYHSNLGLCLQQQGKTKESEAAFKAALRVNPDFLPALFGLGNTSLQSKNAKRAIHYYKKVISADSGYLPAFNNLGNLYRELKDYDEALKMFNRVIEIKPDLAEGWHNIGLVHYGLDDGQQAVQAFKQAISLKPDLIRAYIKLGDSYGLLLNDLQSALDAFDHVLQLNPDYLSAYLHKATVYEVMGLFDESEKILRHVIELDDSRLSVYVHLILGNRYNENDVQTVQTMLNELDMDAKGLVYIHFMLGKIFNNQKEYEKAFRHFQQGNQLHRRSLHFDHDEYDRLITKIIKLFNAEFIAECSRYGSNTERPVFIVGMPRTGTTLTEQILASHPDVYTVGEPVFMYMTFLELFKLLGIANPDELARLSEPRLQQDEIQHLVAHYLTQISHKSPDSKRIIDKMPDNFKYLGLVATLFPRAKIIHCQRNPLDTCVSIYFQQFEALHPYAYDLRELGLYYRDYLRLMAHWQQLFGDQILNVRYEDLVQDQEETSRKLIEYVGLPWDDRCMQFYTGGRAVKTASIWQVRQKVYTDSVGRWKNYQPWLDPLIEALGDCVPGKVKSLKNH